MKGFFVITISLFAFFTTARAQDTTVTITKTVEEKWHRNNFNLRLGPEIGIATGDFSNTHRVGVGVAAELDIPIARRFSLIGYAAFRSYGGKSITNGTKYRRANIFPIRAGINYKLTPNFYVSGQIGESTVRYVTNSKTGVSHALGIGYFNGFLDVGVRWDHEYAHVGLSSINLQATYVITLGVKR